jgi:hypothetical protein
MKTPELATRAARGNVAPSSPSFTLEGRAQPKPHVGRVAARTRKVSGLKIFRNPGKIRPTFQWLFQNDVCKFESYMPSHGVGLPAALDALRHRQAVSFLADIERVTASFSICGRYFKASVVIMTPSHAFGALGRETCSDRCYPDRRHEMVRMAPRRAPPPFGDARVSWRRWLRRSAQCSNRQSSQEPVR